MHVCTCKSFVRHSFYDSPASPAALTFHKILHALQIERFSGNSYRRCLVHFCLFSMISFDDVFVLPWSTKDTKIKQVSSKYYGVLFWQDISDGWKLCICLPCALASKDLIYSQIGSTIMRRWRRALLDKDKIHRSKRLHKYLIRQL